MPDSFLIRKVAGGVFMTKVNDLSAKAVITTGIGMPGSIPWVCALNALQNSMMFRPRLPSAGPIGGDGFALPAGTCSLIKPMIFFAMIGSYLGLSSSAPRDDDLSGGAPLGAGYAKTAARSGRRLDFFDLAEFQLDRRGATEDGDRDAHFGFLVVDFLDVAVEVGERTILDTHLLAHFVQHFRPRLLDAFLHLLHDLVDFARGNRRRLVRLAADETGDFIGVLDQVPGLVRHFHFNQHIAGEETTLGDRLLAILDFDDLFGRHQDLAELVLHAGAFDALGQRALHALFHAGISVHDVPTLAADRHAYCGCGGRFAELSDGIDCRNADRLGFTGRFILHIFAHYFLIPRMTSYNRNSRNLSVPHRKTAITSTKANTIAVIWVASLRVGQTTFFVSRTASLPKFKNSRPAVEVHKSRTAKAKPATSAPARTRAGLSDR